MDAKYNLLRLERKNVINDRLIMEIKNADKAVAKELLFAHLRDNADLATLKEYCDMIVAAEAFPKMQTLGKNMLHELLPEGLSE